MMICLAFCSCSLYAKDNIPQFSDYPITSIYKGTPARLNQADPDVHNFRTRLAAAIKQKPDFAGEYVTTMWGCGGGCRVYSMINKRTGELLKDGFGGEERLEDIIETRVNSRLLVTLEEKLNADYEVEKKVYRFYILEQQKFKLIQTIVKPA